MTYTHLIPTWIGKSIWTVTLILGLSFLANAQQDWREMMFDDNANFKEVQASFEEEFSGPPYAKGTGWKQYKRWEHYHNLRLDENGDIQKPGKLVQEMRAYMQKQITKDYRTGTGNWTELGPIQVPNNGTTQPNGNGRINCIAFHPSDPNTLFVGSPSGGFFESNDDGTTWTKRIGGLVRLGVSSIVVHPLNPDIMYIGTGDRDGGDAPGYGVWRTLDGGATWQSHNTGMGDRTVYEIIMHPADPNIMVAATSNNIWRTTDGGDNWTNFNLGHSCKDLAMHPGDPNIMYASRTNVYKSIDNGATWTVIPTTSGLNPSGHNRIALAVSPANPNIVYAIASGGSGFVGMYQSTDSGDTWTLRSSSPNISGYETDGSGTSSQSFYDHLLVADPNDANTVYFGGINIWKSTNGGTSWTPQTHWVGNADAPGVHADQHALEFNPHTEELYNGNDGGMYKSPDSGNSWIDISSGLGIAQAYKIGVSQTEQDLVINGYQDNGTGIYYSQTGWSTEIGGDGFECQIDPLDENYIYGSLYYGDVRRSTNKGATFNTIAENGVNGITESGAFSAPFTLDPNNASTMYLGMKNVWRSTNVKANPPSWTQISTWSASNLRDVGVSPANSDYIMASSSAGPFYRSTNATTAAPTWTDITANLLSTNTVNDIAFHPTNQDIAWVAQGNNIYQTTDNGNTWVDFRGTLPQISLNAILIDKDSPVEAMYIGMDVGVYYRDNTMTDWELYMTNLPNIEVTDLEIHYNNADCKSTLYAGTYGAGMWKTDLKDPGSVAPVACFDLSGTVLCNSNVVTLQDLSSFTPTGWTWTISPATHNFVNGTTANSQHPEVEFTAPDAYTIALTATNSNGSDTRSKPYTIVLPIVRNLPLADDFESPSTDFNIQNPDGNDTWEETNAASANGVGGSSLMIDNYNYNASGQEDYYQTDVVDLTTATSASLDFDVAYAQYNNGYDDALRVDVSTDCGSTWINVFEKIGPDLSTNGGVYVSGIYTPSSTEWRHEMVNLAAYLGQKIQVRFVAINDYGNRLFLDNINLSGDITLAISLFEFSGKHLLDKGNELVWTMADEEPNLSFQVQRYHERSKEWRNIGQVMADNTRNYRFLDKHYELGKNLYRLELIEVDKIVDYSDIIDIKVEQVLKSVSLFPNPVNNMLTISTQSDADSQKSLQVSDVMGRLLISKTLEVPSGMMEQMLDLSNLAAGVYFVKVGEVVGRIVKR